MPADHDKAPSQPVASPSRTPPLADPGPRLPSCPRCDPAVAAPDAAADRPLESHTRRCEACGEWYLDVRQPARAALIHLPDFLERRGGAPRQRPAHEQVLAQDLVQAVLSDRWPSAATAVDFGLDGQDRYRAMQEAVRLGLTPYELDRVLGDGQGITELVAFVRNDRRLGTVRFSTPYDPPPRADPEPRRRARRSAATDSKRDY